MNICIVTHCLIKGDGQGRVNYEVVWEALRQGHNVTLVASQISLDLRSHPQITWIEISVKSIPTTLLSNVVFSAKSAAWIRRNRIKFDLVNTNGAITSASSEVNSVHFVHTSWLKSPAHISRSNPNFYGLYQWFYSALNSGWEKKAWQGSQVIIAVSEKIRQEIIGIGIEASRVRVVYNGVDIQEFTTDKGDRKSLNLPENVRLAFFAGDIRTSRKNLDTVLKAIQETPDLHLAVAGQTAQSPYPRMAKDLGIDDRVHFLGFRKDMAQIMRSVDFFVFPSRYEACTLVILEAMASGLPVVTAISAGGSELVTQDCGIVLPDCENVRDLAMAFIELSNNPEKCRQMGKAGRSVAERYTWKEMANNYVQIFEEVKSCM
jgi:glycosyltransferase involved in cell wall biosynthesis